MPERCSLCPEPSEGWPADDGGELCQEHWEKQCDDEWWEMMIELDRRTAGGYRG